MKIEKVVTVAMACMFGMFALIIIARGVGMHVKPSVTDSAEALAQCGTKNESMGLEELSKINICLDNFRKGIKPELRHQELASGIVPSPTAPEYPWDKFDRKQAADQKRYAPGTPYCPDFRRYITTMHPEHNFFEVTMLVQSAERSGGCKPWHGEED